MLNKQFILLIFSIIKTPNRIQNHIQNHIRNHIRNRIRNQRNQNQNQRNQRNATNAKKIHAVKRRNVMPIQMLNV